MEKELEEAKAEIERLKRGLADKETIIKQLRMNNDTKSPNVLDELEDRHKKVEEKLKWKVEQFQHLEQAHEKLREQFRACKDEWKTEKYVMIDEISKLNDSIDEGNRAAEELRNQLTMRKQALEKEEHRRKRLEREISEMKTVLENATHDGKLETESSGGETGEEEVANLRHSLRVMEMEYKDMEYKAKKLELENQELLASVRELQEAHIPKAVATPSSCVKLKNRLKQIEQSHRESTASLTAKEAEWTSKAERLNNELRRYTTILKMKDEAIDELKQEIKSSNSTLTQMKMQNEELSLMVQLMSSENSKGGVAQLMDQVQKERENKLVIQEELDQLREELQQVRDALDIADAELTEQTNEKRELELELEDWKSKVGDLEKQVTRSHSMRKELELSLLAQAEIEEMLKQDTEEKEKRIGHLEHQVYLMDQEIRVEIKDEKLTERLKMGDAEQLQLELLERRFEEATIGHKMGEKTRTFEQAEHLLGPAQKHQRIVIEDDTICALKKNTKQQYDAHSRKIGDSIIEERSPFKELN